MMTKDKAIEQLLDEIEDQEDCDDQWDEFDKQSLKMTMTPSES